MKKLFLFIFFTIAFLVLVKSESVELSQPFIHVVTDGNKLINTEIGVLNFGKKEELKITISSQENFIEIDHERLTLNKGESGTLKIGLNPTEKKSGVYVGEINIINDRVSSALPVIMEVQTPYPIFDVSLENIASLSEPNTLRVDITVYKLKGHSQDVKLSYFLAETNGKIIFQDEENLKVERQTNLKKSFSLSYNEDEYIFYVIVSDSLGVSVGTGAFLFSPIKISYSPVQKQSSLPYLIAAGIIIFLIIAFFIFTYYWTRRVKMTALGWKQKIAEVKKDRYNNRRKAIRKLAYQLSLLKSARARGYIKENSYREAKAKINLEINKLKKLL